MTRTKHPSLLFTLSIALLLADGRQSIAADAARQLPPEYPPLAKAISRLIVPVETSREAFPDEEPSMAEGISELHAVAMDLRGIRSDNGQISYIASQSERAVAEEIGVLERLEMMPKPSALDVFVGSFACGYLGDPIVGPTRLAVDDMKKQDDLVAEFKKAVAIWNRLDGIHRLLPRVAEKHAPAVADQPDRVLVDFDEAWGPVGPYDCCLLRIKAPT